MITTAVVLIMRPPRSTSLFLFTLATVVCQLLFAVAVAKTNIEPVHYEDFGAKGDGKTDDGAAIAKTHAHANRHGLPVEANDSAIYYISGKHQTALIQTDTDFGKARFIIDDRHVADRNAPVFRVISKHKSFPVTSITSLKRNQKKVAVKLPHDCLVVVKNDQKKHFIRKGLNPNNGYPQTDVLIVHKNGSIDPSAPVQWGFDHISEIRAIPIDTKKLTITGGHFTTIANDAESEYNYHNRGITIQRSNVTVRHLEHHVRGEGEHGAPYRGFLTIHNSYHVIIRDCKLSGHKTYRTIGRAGKPVSMGSYDISMARSVGVALINCRQINDINDRSRWGIMASNHCKNIIYDRCSLSRFDAHMGVYGATIRNSTIGHAGINATGGGTLRVTDSKIHGRSLVNLRSDYGSTWRGDFIIRDCKFIPAAGKPVTASLIGGRNDGTHDFGYPCSMPEEITITNLFIDDSKHPENYRGPWVFADFSPGGTPKDQNKHPYKVTRRLVLKNVTTVSKKPLRMSSNPSMFEDVKVTGSLK